MGISRGFGGTGRRIRRLSLAALAALLAFGAAESALRAPHRAEAAGPNLAVNPGFEDSDSDWVGWTYDGTWKNGDTPAVRLSVDEGADFVHSGGHSLAYWLDEPFGEQDYVFVMNFSGQEAIVEGVPEGHTDAESGEAVSGALALGVNDVRILRRPARAE